MTTSSCLSWSTSRITRDLRSLSKGWSQCALHRFSRSSFTDLTSLDRFWKKRHKILPSASGDKSSLRAWHTAKAYIRKSRWSIEQRGGLVHAGGCSAQEGRCVVALISCLLRCMSSEKRLHCAGWGSGSGSVLAVGYGG